MLPNPLHPAVVHFPVVLVILLPFFALGALWAIRRGARPFRAWLVPVAIAAALVVSAFVALRTGKAQEEKVEPVISERVLEGHEEAAERFLVLSGVLLAIASAGLLGGIAGRSARVVATVGALGLVVAGVQVGDSGGKLVYGGGAASVYAVNGASPAAAAPGAIGPVDGVGGGARPAQRSGRDDD